MKARFLVLFAALVLVGTLPAQAIQRAPAVADPASAPIVSSAPASPTDETKVPHYFGPYPNWANSPMTLPDATVTIDAAAVAPVSVGNPLVDRAFATDFATGPGTLGPVLVVLPNAVLPHGTLDSFQVWNQATTGGSPTPSEGGVFYALVLHPTGVPNEYTVAYVSSQLTMPAGTDPAGNIASFPAGIAVVAGDVIGFYGEGIPVDDAGTGSDILSYPATANADLVTPQAPAQGDTLSIGSAAGYPLFSTTRTYSFGAVVTPPGTGAGSGATAEATVGANGAVTGLTITNPGAGYVVPPTVTISGSGSGATADAVIQASGAVTSVTVDQAGAGYTQPSVTFSGGGATTDATGHVLGGVDAVTLADPGSGYVFPTIDFDLPDDPNGIQAQGHAVCVEENCAPASDGATVTITGIAVDNPGSGYAKAPGIFVRDGTQFDPVAHDPTVNPLTLATATATLSVQEVVLDTFGAGYTSSPTVAFADTGTGTGASATAATDFGSVVALNLTNPGSGYITGGGMRKFVDELPGLTPDGVNNLGQYIPIAQPDTTTFPDDPNVPGDQGADYYVIAVVQHREQMHSDLPPTLLREYVQLSTAAVPGNQVALQTALKAGGTTPTLMPDGTQAYGVDDPHFLGPVIVAQRDRAVRITFYNLLPTGSEGDLFLPVDSTIMGSGMGPAPNMAMPMDEGTVTDGIRNPICTDDPQDAMCFKQNRATLHLHGGVTPWISDGTPHQWITPAGENTMWPKGVAVQEVPDMVGAEAASKGIPDCSAGTSGCQTFYYTNQQSARLMFYHDHSWGITRLNVYAGEAAGYIITDLTEQKLFGPGGPYAAMGEGIPLIIQDRTFTPDEAQLALQDPTWDSARWGTKGSFWYHHVYMPAQNPGDPSGMSAYGRWMYGPWFWPPATPDFGPIDNPYYDPNCNLNDPATWQYQEDPFCEPAQIPGTPNISAGMEQFNDTPLVNGTAYPTTTLQPASYRFRILNAANDRFWNLQWYVADDNGTPNDPSDDTEVALKADEVAAAQLDPVLFPTPDLAKSPAGPDWIQFGTEGGFLPSPVVVDGQQVTTWITDPTRFDVGNVDKHSLLLAPAERADTIVDFSQFAGKTLILYNDAPAAFPARVPSYDYYTGSQGILPGYGPNTRTVMQVKIADTAPASAFNFTAFRNLFTHKANLTGVFEEGQHPIIVGQAAYNSAYGTSFASSGDCSDVTKSNKCDGYLRINQQGGTNFRFDTLRGDKQLQIPIQPKAIHDEMNSTAFDEFGRMTANLGLEAVPATPALQNVMLYPYVAPATEVIDATNLPVGDVNVTAISSATDGTQIWKVTHNGVDTHPIHFHLYDVQVLNRVTWDNIIIPPDATELGWKDTVRISPLEDTIVALRPIIPTLPFEIPNSIRPLSPMTPLGADLDPKGLIVDPQGNVTTILNALVNYGWEYVYHCHILSHEEMDMMRPVMVALPPLQADGLTWFITGSGNNRRFTLSWNDNSITETQFVLQRSINGTAWTNVGTSVSPLDQPNTHGTRSLRDSSSNVNTPYLYRVAAQNTVGYGGAFATVTVESLSDAIPVGTMPTSAPLAPTNLAVTLQSGPQARLTWRDNATNESGFNVERAIAGSNAFAVIAVAPARNSTGNTTFTDTTVESGVAYDYRVAAVNLFGGQVTVSAYSNVAGTGTAAAVPAAPTNFAAANGPDVQKKRQVVLNWMDNSNNETGFVIQRATNAAFTTGLAESTVLPNTTQLTVGGLSRATTYYFRIRAINGTTAASAWVSATPFPIITNP